MPRGLFGVAEMNADGALSLMRLMLWKSMLVTSPVLVVTLAVGLLISITQVVTQLQEMTLSYVPKLLASAVVLMFLGAWMMRQVTQFAISVIALIPTLG